MPTGWAPHSYKLVYKPLSPPLPPGKLTVGP